MPRPSGARRWKRGSANSPAIIRDEVVRRYYRQDFSERLQRTFAPEAARGAYSGGHTRGGNFGRESPRRFAPRTPGDGRPICVPPAAAASGGMAQPEPAPRALPGGKPAACGKPDHARPAQRDFPPRGADPAMPDQSPLAAARPSGGGGGAGIGPPGRRTNCAPASSLPLPTIITIRQTRPSRPRRCAPISQRADFRKFFKGLSGRSRPRAVWGARAGAAREDVLSTWHQLVALHRQWHSLLRELKDAEAALGGCQDGTGIGPDLGQKSGEESSEANLAWLRDVKARLESLDGTEALIEGFGELSGRFQRSV